MFSDLTDEQVRRIISAISKIQKYAEEIKLEPRREKH
jgi:hypothetical protein